MLDIRVIRHDLFPQGAYSLIEGWNRSLKSKTIFVDRSRLCIVRQNEKEKV